MQLENQKFHKEVVELLNNARNKVKRSVDSIMTYTYYEVGRRRTERRKTCRIWKTACGKFIQNIDKRIW